MRKVYNQKQLTITVDGITMQDYMDGASIILTYDGGEVDKLRARTALASIWRPIRV